MRKTTMSVIAAIALFGAAPVSQSIAGQISPDSAQEQALVDDSGFGEALTGEKLGAESGRELTIEKLDMQITTSTLSGEVGNNVLAGTSITGYNSISDGAFTNMNGFATVIQNSGNQVLIQNDMIVNVSVY